MAAGEERVGNFYSVLGLEKECSDAEVKNAYRKLAKKWHPDRCMGSESSKMEQATTKFQEIHEAYSALADPDKRLTYDLDIEEESSDVEPYGTRDFLDELSTAMNKIESSNKSTQESFQELQDMFQEMQQEEDMFQEMLHKEVKASPNHQSSNISSSPSPYYVSKDTPSYFGGMMAHANMPLEEEGFGTSDTSFCLRGKSEFLDDLATMMSKTDASHKGAEESFKELQDMFEEMIQEEVKAASNYHAADMDIFSKDTTSCFDGMMANASVPFGERGLGKSDVSSYFGESKAFGSKSVNRGTARRGRRNLPAGDG